MIHSVADETETKHVLIDSTRPSCARTSICLEPEKNGPQALGRSRSGLTTTLHLAADDAERSLRLIATEGQVSDISFANELVEHFLRTGAVIADKGYDSKALVESIRATRGKALIPPRSNRKTKRRYSRVLYRTRNIVESNCDHCCLDTGVHFTGRRSSRLPVGTRQSDREGPTRKSVPSPV
ncbi:transposase [Trinickia sp. LjRoot230]|uniref:transposase n=1 Tax=Trinickia sp. LjRoot230 TaxID=3342288 RepID=UPI003ECE2841